MIIILNHLNLILNQVLIVKNAWFVMKIYLIWSSYLVDMEEFVNNVQKILFINQMNVICVEEYYKYIYILANSINIESIKEWR